MTNTQVARFCKPVLNGSLTNIKLSKTQLHKIVQSGGFLGRLLGPLLKTVLPLVGNVLKPLAKSVIKPSGLSAAASATDAAIHNKILGSGFTTLVISNEEIEDIMKIVKSLEDSGWLIKGISETIQNKAKEQKGGFISMLFGTLSPSLLGSLLTGKRTIRAGEKF